MQDAFNYGASTWTSEFNAVNANISAGNDQNGNGFTVVVVPQSAMYFSTSLAETYQPGQNSTYPNGAIFVLDTWAASASFNDMRALMTHEVGHGFGLADLDFGCTYESVRSTSNSAYAGWYWLSASDRCWLNNGWNPYWTPPGGQPYLPAPVALASVVVGMQFMAVGLLLSRRRIRRSAAAISEGGQP